ncbi:GNAT family N-acetyltransferase [Kineobactrum sediminis]|nr:GNAT family N-acetyltransferase [Kineobactrum sediminis]
MYDNSSSITNLDLVIVLADSRLDNPYHANEAQKAHDRGDVVRLQEAMGRLGDGNNRVTYLDNHRHLLDELRRIDPDLVLNFCNAGFGNQPELQMHVPALLEMFGLPFAGADAACLAKCHDKASINAAAINLDIPTPRMELLRLGTGQLPQHYPVILKLNEGSGSMGISTGSVVRDPRQASARLSELARESPATEWVVAEEFLDGREFSVAVLGNPEPGMPPFCLPALEVDFSKLPANLPRIMTHDSKADSTSPYWQQLAIVAADLPDTTREAVERQCLQIFSRFGCRDYARFDFRTDAQGTPRLIDANAHPEWGAESMMARMAGFAGIQYEDFLGHIIRSARCRAAPKRPAALYSENRAPMLDARGIHLRPTRPEDIAFVREVESAPENCSMVEQWPADKHLDALYQPHRKHLIIEDEAGKPAGYAILEGLQGPEQTAFLRRIVVAHKHHGIGDRALQAIESYCFDELGVTDLKLEVHDNNGKAIGLYRKHGFREEGRYGMVQMAMHNRHFQAPPAVHGDSQRHSPR